MVTQRFHTFSEPNIISWGEYCVRSRCLVEIVPYSEVTGQLHGGYIYGSEGRERARILTYRVELDITMTVTYSYHAYDDDIQIGMIYRFTQGILPSRSISMTGEPRTCCKEECLLV